MAEAEGADPARWKGAAESMVLGYALLALVSAGSIALGLSLPAGGVLVRAQHHVFDALPTLGLGVAHGLVVWLARDRLKLPALLALGLLALASAPVLVPAVGNEMRRQACVLFDGRFELPLYVAFVTLASLALPAAHLVGALVQRWRFGPHVPVAVSVAAMGACHAVLRDDYPGIHAVVGWVAATLAGASLARLGARLRGAVRRRRALLVLGAGALLSLALPPPNRVRIELFRSPVAPAAWVSATLFWPSPSPSPSLRSPPPPVPGEGRVTTPPLVSREAAPVVVLVTIDSLRADVLARSDAPSRFPALSRMADKGVSFSRAVSPGSQTAVALSSVFSGRYFSQLRFDLFGEGSSRFAYPALDPTPRFPALLAEAGARTSSYCGLAFLGQRFGVIRGFTEEHMLVQGRRHGTARELVAPLLDGLRRVGPAAAFFYVHLMEPHFPYDRGRTKKGPAFERYLSEVSVADGYVERIARVLEQRLAGRGFLFVTSDHGEAFGEHGTTHHTKTLYEELLHVPLLVTGPGVATRRVEERVSLIDLGPTILDLFGLPAPEGSMGQTLVPLLAGRPHALSRPVFAEGRLRRAHWGRGGIKVIEDLRRKTVEAYDLEKDPGERENLWDEGDLRADEALAAMRAFFESTALEDYDPPYKP